MDPVARKIRTSRIDVFVATQHCRIRPGSGGQWYHQCRLGHAEIVTDGVSEAGDNADLTEVLDRIFFKNELTYVFQGRVLPFRNAGLSIELPVQSRQETFTLAPRAVGDSRPTGSESDALRVDLRRGEAGSAKYIVNFPADGRSDGFLTVSGDCELIVLSNVTVPDIGALSVYFRGLIGYFEAMVTAYEAVLPTDVAVDAVVAAARQADGVLSRLLLSPLDPITLRQVSNSQQALRSATDGITRTCGPNLPEDRCSEQRAAAIEAIRVLHDRVKAELEAARRFLAAERQRLESRAEDVARQIDDLLNEVTRQRSRKHALLSASDTLEQLEESLALTAQRTIASPRARVRLRSSLRPLETNGEITLNYLDNVALWDDRFRHATVSADGSLHTDGDADHPTLFIAKFGAEGTFRIRYEVIGYGNVISDEHKGPIFSLSSPSSIYFAMVAWQPLRSLEEIRADRPGEYKVSVEFNVAASGGYDDGPPGMWLWIRDNHSETEASGLGGWLANAQTTITILGTNPRAGWAQQTLSAVGRFHTDRLSKGLDVYAGVYAGKQVQFRSLRYEISRYID
jgi:hypothetical protein